MENIMSKRAVFILSVIGLCFFLAGCMVPPKGGFDYVEQNVQQRIGQRVQWNQDAPEDKVASKAVASMLERPLTADDAVQIALLNNRRLQATYEELGITQAALVQAGLLKNPRFSASYLPSVEAGPVATVGLELAQDFADLLFVGMRKRIAASEFEASKARVTSVVLDKAAETRVAFLEYQSAEQFLEKRRLIADAASVSFELSQKLFEAGNITNLAATSEKANLNQAKLDLSRAQATVLSQRERLNSLMGLWGTQSATWRFAGQLPELPKDEIDIQNIERHAIVQSLDLAKTRAKAEAAAGRAGLTKWSTLLSDFEIGVANNREDDGSWHVGPIFSLQIPIFDQGQAKNAAAAAELRRALQEYAAEAIELRSAARAARNRLVEARDRAVYCRDVLLPARDEVLHESQLQYNAMQIGAFQLIAAKRSVIDSGIQNIEALRDYWIARAEIELILAGRNMPSSQPSESSALQSGSERKEH